MTLLRPFLSIASWATVVAGVFQTTIFDAESPLNGQVLNAAGGGFHLGLSKPGSFCPHPTDCPGGATTLFASMNALWVYTLLCT